MSSKTTPNQRHVVIVSPAMASANNGNWQTASRWARMIGTEFHVRIVPLWQGEPCDVLIALHARRSGESVNAYSQAHPGRALIVVLTGTDLYRDIRTDAAAQRSLELATHLVTLQARGPDELPPPLRAKCSVIYQSARRFKPEATTTDLLRVVQVGHLRDEKDPRTYMRAAQRLAKRSDIAFEHIGDGTDPELATAAQGTQAQCSYYRWFGALPHATTRRHIRHAQLLVNTSRMEGGAHVVLEAALSGTAALASRIPGNLGMLGPEHDGYFDVGDDATLAALIARARDDADFLAHLRAQTLARAPLFTSGEEQRRLLRLLNTALETTNELR